jgi:hypothetical protein
VEFSGYEMRAAVFRLRDDLLVEDVKAKIPERAAFLIIVVAKLTVMKPSNPQFQNLGSEYFCM